MWVWTGASGPLAQEHPVSAWMPIGYRPACSLRGVPRFECASDTDSRARQGLAGTSGEGDPPAAVHRRDAGPTVRLSSDAGVSSCRAAGLTSQPILSDNRDVPIVRRRDDAGFQA